MMLLTDPDQDIREYVLAVARHFNIDDEGAVEMALARAARSDTQGDAQATIAEACRFLHSWHRHPSNARLPIR